MYTLEIRIVNGTETRGLFKWNSLDEARQRMYGEMSYGMALDGCEAQKVAILTEDLAIYKVEVWEAEKPVEEVEE